MEWITDSRPFLLHICGNIGKVHETADQIKFPSYKYWEYKGKLSKKKAMKKFLIIPLNSVGNFR
jgi:hypothetical protein